MKSKPEKENRGGAREGAGRKPSNTSYDEKFKFRLDKVLRKVAKDLGFSDPLEAFADLALNPVHQGAVRASAWKIITETYTVKQSHQTVEKIEGPQIMLPALKPKPVPEGMVREDDVEHRVH